MSKRNRGSAEMPFLDHLEELRWRLLKSIAAVLIGTLIGFVVVTRFNVLELLIDPLRPLIGDAKLKYLSPGDPFFVTLGLAVTVGLLLALPVVVSQVWGFISPALLPREKRALVPALYLGLVLFAGGVALAYYIVLPMTLRFFMGFQTQSLEQNIVIGPYIGLIVKVLLAFGLLFELPVVVLVLASLGLVTSKFLAAKRRYAIAGIAVLAAIATPGDAVTLTIFMMGPLILLYELSIFLARFVERRRRRALEVSTAVAVALLLFAPPRADAQQTPPPARAAQVQQQDTTKKTPAQIVLEKVRRLGQAEQRDTAPDSIALRERTRSQTNRPSRETKPAADFPADSIMRALMQMADFAATQYRGDSVQFIADSSRLMLYGKENEKAGVAREGQAMIADSLVTFDDETSIACGYGHPVLTGEDADAPVVSERVCYNTRSKVGMAIGARTQVSEGANWFITGDLYSREKDLYTHNAKFTDCSLEIPHYHFAAKEVKVINDNVMVARNVTLNFGDVPVFWLPFMMQSLKQGRRSGILMPEFSVNDIVRRNSSYDRRIRDVGFYWAISDKLGAKVSLDWWSGNYTAVEGSFDYNLLRSFMNGGATFKRYWREGGQEFTLAANHSWEPDERTSLRMDAQYATSTAFIKQTTYDPRELRRSIISNVGLSRRFNWASISMQASRTHFLTDDKIDWTLPSLGVNFSTVTLFPKSNTGTWTASAQVRRTQTNFANSAFDPSAITGAASSGLTLGKLSWSQSFDADQKRAIRAVVRDTVMEIDEQTGDTSFVVRQDTSLTSGQTMRWRSSLSFQQRLIGTTTFTPGISIGQDLVKSDTLGNVTIGGPMRMDVNAAIKLDLFGFWPGVGPLSRLRHRISPSITYSYSPKTSVDRADSVRFKLFGGGTALERNTISIGINQTIEGKYKEEAKREGEGADSAAIDSTTSIDPDKPRRLPQAKKVTVLSLNTDAVVYDFAIAKRGGTGVQTMQITNSLNSDLLRGLQLTFSHDLWAPNPDTVPGTGPGQIFFKRKFDPHLNRVSASFSLSNNSWLFRMFGLGKKTDAPPQTGSSADSVENARGGPEATGNVRPEFGLIGSRNRQTAPVQRGPTGAWNASFNLTLEMPRDLPNVEEISNQMVTTNVSFQPTQQWNLSWNTGYSFSRKEFTDHILTLTRQMHDWDANFNFVKAQNGNFSFVFNVALRANPDLKFDYSQRSLRRNQ